jgi:diaminohydroxyphosphoribosylaminopyrimidine deaminase/5-amino-6-(5-phosphoribosylamino)uracil reductase
MSDFNDKQYLLQCFALAELGRHTCSPNPVVGCVIVRDGQTVGEGWHQITGQAHAEVVALRQAGDLAFGATAYVSLEPCSHHGRTGPCTEALISSGVSRVVYAMQDPNPQVAGKGAAHLHASGVQVVGPLLQEQAENLNPGFLKRMREGLPHVRLKLAMSLDGRTAMASGESQWITGPEARADVQQWRARSDAVLSGIGTILKDDASLNVRLAGYAGKQPVRVIVDSQGRMPPQAKLLNLPGPVLVALGHEHAWQVPEGCLAEVAAKAFPNPEGKVDLKGLMHYLAENLLVNEVLVEAGPTLCGALLQAGLVDELLVYVAPKLLGHEAKSLLQLPGLEKLADTPGLRFTDVVMVGEDCRITAVPDAVVNTGQ